MEEEAANHAVTELSGLEVLGRQLRADMARPREQRPRRDVFNGRGDGGGGSYHEGGGGGGGAW